MLLTVMSHLPCYEFYLSLSLWDYWVFPLLIVICCTCEAPISNLPTCIIMQLHFAGSHTVPSTDPTITRLCPLVLGFLFPSSLQLCILFDAFIPYCNSDQTRWEVICCISENNHFTEALKVGQFNSLIDYPCTLPLLINHDVVVWLFGCFSVNLAPRFLF